MATVDDLEVIEPYRCALCTHYPSQCTDKCEVCKPGDHCQQCGQPGCVCCECHGVYPCPEDDDDDGGGHGQSLAVAPWEERGHKLATKTGMSFVYGSWEHAWPRLAEQHQKTDPCQVAADFYLLDAVRHKVLNMEHDCSGACRHVELIRNDPKVVWAARYADQQFKSLVDALDRLFAEYVDMAVGGELRHHRACGGKSLSGSRRRAWADWRYVREQVGVEALRDADALFRDFVGNSYGGRRWGDAAKLLHDRLTNRITPEQWVDRVFALVHNGGVFLNKLHWAVNNRRRWGLSQLQSKVLPAQAEDTWKVLLAVCSSDTREVWGEYWHASNRARVRAGLRPTPNPRSSNRTRTICVHCSTNPSVGHHLFCTAFLQGGLPISHKSERLSIASVGEEDWGGWDWREWNKRLLPVLPDGRVIILPDEEYGLRLHLDAGFTCCRVDSLVRGGQLMNEQVSLSKLLSASWVWPHADKSTGYQWSVSLCTPDFNITLAYMAGKRVQVLEDIKKVVLDMGLLFMMAEHSMVADWSHVTPDYMKAKV